MMDIIIKSLIGEHASSSLYCLGRCEWLNKSVSDVLYVPKTENLAPILIEVQHDVNEDFYFKSLCQKGKTQFRKIINCIENNIPKEKIRQHAINGEIFFMQQARKFDEKQREVTPIEDTAEISNLTAVAYHNINLTTDDNAFVEDFIAKTTGRVSWGIAMNKEKKKSFFFFLNHTTWKSLKTSYNRKAKMVKRKRALTFCQSSSVQIYACCYLKS